MPTDSLTFINIVKQHVNPYDCILRATLTFLEMPEKGSTGVARPNLLIFKTKVYVMERMHFTRASIEALPDAAPGKRDYFYDDRIDGLQVAVTDRGTKSFCVYRKIKGRPKRIILGRHPDLSPAGARTAAIKTLAKIAEGVDPIAEKRATRARGVTLDDAFKAFKLARKNLKPKTLYDYAKIMDTAFPDWQRHAVAAISKDDIAKRHRALGTGRGQAYANLAMRVLRSVLNFASAQFEAPDGSPLLPDNPVRRLSQTRAWYRDRRRDTYIKQTELPAWFEAVESLREGADLPTGPTVADYLLVLLFTGLRRQEAAHLRWSDVDLAARELIVRETKNHEPHTLPLSDYLKALFQVRSEMTSSEWVFPGADDGCPLVEPRAAIARVVKRSGIAFTLHDLRRTFVTIAESLDIPAYALKRLVNHKMRHDVTAGYIQITPERLRRPMQTITDFVLASAHRRPGGDVVAFHQVDTARDSVG